MSQFLLGLVPWMSVFTAAFSSSLCSSCFSSQVDMANMSTAFVDSFNRENGDKDRAITFDEAVVHVNGLNLNGPLTTPLKSDRAVGDVNVGDLPLRDMVDTGGKVEQFADVSHRWNSSSSQGSRCTVDVLAPHTEPLVSHRPYARGASWLDCLYLTYMLLQKQMCFLCVPTLISSYPRLVHRVRYIESLCSQFFWCSTAQLSTNQIMAWKLNLQKLCTITWCLACLLSVSAAPDPAKITFPFNFTFCIFFKKCKKVLKREGQLF